MNPQPLPGQGPEEERLQPETDTGLRPDSPFDKDLREAAKRHDADLRHLAETDPPGQGERWRYEAVVIYEGDTVPTKEAARLAAEELAAKLGGDLHHFAAFTLIDPQEPATDG